MGAPAVKWTDAESEAFVTAYVEFEEQNPEATSREKWNAALEALPPDRSVPWRKGTIHSMNRRLGAMADQLKDLRAAALANKIKAEKAAARKKAEAVKAEAAKVEAAKVEAAKVEAVKAEAAKAEAAKVEVETVESDSPTGHRRIFWKPSEHSAVAKYYVMFESLTPKATIPELLDKAQAEAIKEGALDPARMRWFKTFHTTNNVDFYNAVQHERLMLRQAADLAKEAEAKKAEALKEAEAKQEEAIKKAELAEAAAAMLAKEKAALARREAKARQAQDTAMTSGGLFKAAFAALFAEILESPRVQLAIAKAVSGGLPRQEHRQEPTQYEDDAPELAPATETSTNVQVFRPVLPKAPAKTRLRRILIVGLRSSQEETIKYEFGDRFDLRFAATNTIQPVKSVIPTMDVVIGMISQLSHSMSDHLKQAADYRPVNGGTSDLRRVLHAIGTDNLAA